MNHQFEIPGGYRKWTMGLIGIGVLTLICGFIFLHPFQEGGHGGHGNTDSTRFWAVLLQNSTFWLLVVNAAMFFICVTTLAMGGWQVALKRVPEAISSTVPILGAINIAILLALVFGHRHDIYHWLDAEAVQNDKFLRGKAGFLNPWFYLIFSIAAVALWSWLGHRMRRLSLEDDARGHIDVQEGQRWIWRNTVAASLFLVVFVLTVASTIPWLWLMSIDAHWYSTMYSWYTFASTFVSGIALITLFVVYLKNQGKLEYVTEEHLHDLGKFMFAFSIFWTYLWFSQYMLIWYANIPEETAYFKPRVQGPYRGIFLFNLIVNFVCPFLILMKRASKRNYALITFMSVLIIFGHWIDFYQMVMPGTVGAHPTLSWFEFGIPLLFIGLIMWGTGRYLSKVSLLPKNHPFLKESMIHHT
jgi:hypothetical protein